MELLHVAINFISQMFDSCKNMKLQYLNQGISVLIHFIPVDIWNFRRSYYCKRWKTRWINYLSSLFVRVITSLLSLTFSYGNTHYQVWFQPSVRNIPEHLYISLHQNMSVLVGNIWMLVCKNNRGRSIGLALLNMTHTLHPKSIHQH